MAILKKTDERLEFIDDFNKRLNIFDKPGEKVPSDAKKFIERLKTVRNTLNALEEETSAECTKFSEDVKHWAEFQTGVKVFEPWMKKAENRKLEGLRKPISLVEACEILGDSKNLQDEAEAKLRVLEEAAASSQKMTSHQEA